ncbi:oxygenase MpaB family protein [Flavihumibacter petaseus]|uniref:ER-bound oxygenase mpaB/mpaB'/Rubber oxygenase catalytic domain-containing protein n=1 Tax=Flavihumibacter petaseus NBRC 106054 TaxID=1220578 RepID=A0A0E9MYW8_9BACT|nr:oxygenase MpaB family protein [Flavihumibacter petaseus]GAO42907.1 hypothetical protein FPE01S_02_00120 [Flavihumibacter petaseus NBRC 106054]
MPELQASPYVPQHHLLRRIWGRTDAILLIFAGAAAEFALNKAVDWLYFTGKLPADPIGRLFSTVTYAQRIIFADTASAHAAIDQITRIHHKVETERGASIPQWAYRDVLFMLIHYSIAAATVLGEKPGEQDKEEIYTVFRKMGERMRIEDLPDSYRQWETVYRQHLLQDLANGALTHDLFQQYRKHLGWWRYRILLESQKLVVPATVRSLLQWKSTSLLTPAMPLYRLTRGTVFEKLLQYLVIPARYRQPAAAMEQR